MVRMKRLNCLASNALLAVLAATVPVAQAQSPADRTPVPPLVNSALDGKLFYQLLLGELNADEGEPGAGYSLVLDAARKTNDAGLYQRAVDIALQARSGESALQAARAWKQAQPDSRQANRLMLQILIALNRISETTGPLKNEIAMATPPKRNLAISAIPRIYARASDKKMAASVVEQALADELANPATGASAWTTVGRMRLAAADTAGALEAARRAQALDSRAEDPALLALELMDPKVPLAEPIVRKYLEGEPTPEVRMAYVRALLNAQRYREASQQLQIITAGRPDFAEAWLVRGALQEQDNQNNAAEASLKRYVELIKAQKQGEERDRGLAQAYLSLAQIAEKRKDFSGAEAWLNRIENSQDLVSVQSRRASLLARQGKLDEGLKLIRSIPERTPADARMKLMSEVQLLRDNKQYQPAYDLLSTAAARDPKDTDLMYDQAMLAEKLNNTAEMERLLRQLIAVKPDYSQAYNALGYSLADRGERIAQGVTDDSKGAGIFTQRPLHH